MTSNLLKGSKVKFIKLCFGELSEIMDKNIKNLKAQTKFSVILIK